MQLQIFIRFTVTYKGKYKVKNPSKYKGDALNVIYRSMWERYCFKWLDENPSIKEWSSEEVIVPYFFDIDKQYHRYFVDLKYTTVEGTTYLIEVKPKKQTEPPQGKRKTRQYVSEAVTYVQNQCKWKAATKYADERGWHFKIWTEQDLYAMGIMPKPLPAYPKKK